MRSFLFSPAIEEMFRIAPDPCLAIWAAASCVSRNREKTFSS